MAPESLYIRKVNLFSEKRAYIMTNIVSEINSDYSYECPTWFAWAHCSQNYDIALCRFVFRNNVARPCFTKHDRHPEQDSNDALEKALILSKKFFKNDSLHALSAPCQLLLDALLKSFWDTPLEKQLHPRMFFQWVTFLNNKQIQHSALLQGV